MLRRAALHEVDEAGRVLSPCGNAQMCSGAHILPRDGGITRSLLRSRAMPLRADRLEDGHGTTQGRAHRGSRRFARATKTREPLRVRGTLRTATTTGERARRSVGELLVEEHTIRVRLAGVFQRGITRTRRTGRGACDWPCLGRSLGRRGAGRRRRGGLTACRMWRSGLQRRWDLRGRITSREETDREDGNRPHGSYGIRAERLHRVPMTFKSSN